MIGRMIHHYEILEKLGEGGMGVVYKAHDTKLDRHVAIKFLPGSHTVTDEDKTRFIHEARAASALEHSNICAIYEINETPDGQLFIVMPAYEGTPLNKKIEDKPLAVSEAIEIAIQIADGLQAAHEKGIVHRDIKSSNIFITEKGQVKVMDFGLARSAGVTQMTKTGITVGTVPYMSPEQALGNPVDHRTDIWALGVTMYEMLTGQMPFKSEYRDAVIYAILNENPKPVTELRPDIPPDLESVINKCMEKDPDLRYQSMNELRDNLQLLLHPEGTPSKRISRRKRLSRITQIRTILGTVVLAGITLLIIYWLIGSKTAFSFTERDWILLTDFENQTQEDVFDNSLNTALRVSIEQSRYVNVFPRQRIRETLQRMKIHDVTYIGEQIGREISEREGINVMVVPSISRVGDTYVLTAVIRDIKDITVTRSEIVSAKSEDEVLNALDKLSKRIRSVLGESFLSISRQSKPLADATTSSLEALKQYTLAHENHRAGNFQDAKLYYENALRVDSTFSMARAGLGMMHIVGTERNLQGFDSSRGKELIDEALQNLDGLTDKEKYAILVFHAGTVEGDFEKGSQYCKALLAIYPDYGPAYNNLGWFYERLGRYLEAIDNFKQAIRFDPSLLVAYRGICYRYEHLGEIDSALVWAKRWTAEYPDDANGWTYLGWMFLGKDSLRQAQTTFQKAREINPHFTLILYNLGHTYRLQGNYREAIQSLQRILEISPSDSWVHYQLGVLYHLLGDNQTSHRHFENIKKEVETWVRQDPEIAYNYYLLGLILTRLGETQRGWDMGQKAFAMDSTQHFGYAQLLALHGQTQEAIDQLELAVQKGYQNYIVMKIHMDLQPLNNEPRFMELLNRVIKG
jgi:eukaryotic-like serine/threonine-protein kinase